MLGLLITLLTPAAWAQILTGRVVGVTDGDTITVLDDLRVQHKIRLAGIDAPEKSQAFGQRSKAFLSSLVFSKPVVVETQKTDRYGRTVGKVLVDNGCLQSMGQAAALALQQQDFHLVADAGYANGEQAQALQQQGIEVHAPVKRSVNNQGDGTLFERSQFIYDASRDTYDRCGGCPPDRELPPALRPHRSRRTARSAARLPIIGARSSAPAQPGCQGTTDRQAGRPQSGATAARSQPEIGTWSAMNCTKEAQVRGRLLCCLWGAYLQKTVKMNEENALFLQ